MKPRLKILVVDDSVVMQRILSEAIETVGFQPIAASNGQLALDVIEQQSNELALILLDWNMPVMDGLATLRTIKSDSRYKEIPIMMVTTECERQRVVEAIKAGAQHYLTKPFTPQDLAVRIMECLGEGLTTDYSQGN